MKTKVIKIGGSCLSKPSDIKQLIPIFSTDEDFILVVSAFKNVTNLLELWYDTKEIKYLTELRNIHKNIFDGLFFDEDFDRNFYFFADIENVHRNDVTRNQAQALGEYMSSGMIEKYLKKEGIEISMLFGDPLIFGDNTSYNFEKSSDLIRIKYKERIHRHVLTQGFVSKNNNGEKDNLGREGSDLTAVIWAQALGTECILYKDVGAIYNSDPNLNLEAQKITSINLNDYKNDFYSSGVIYNKVIDFCIEQKLPLSIYSFSDNNLGTTITIEML